MPRASIVGKVFAAFAGAFSIFCGLGMKDGCEKRDVPQDERERDAFYAHLQVVDDGSTTFLRFACAKDTVEYDLDARRIRDGLTSTSPNATITRLTPAFSDKARAALGNELRGKSLLMQAWKIARPKWAGTALGIISGYDVGRRITAPKPVACDSAGVQALAHDPARWSNVTSYAFVMIWARWIVQYDAGDPAFEPLDASRFSIANASNAELDEFSDRFTRWFQALEKPGDLTSADLRFAREFRDWLRNKITKNPALYISARRFKITDASAFE